MMVVKMHTCFLDWKRVIIAIIIMIAYDYYYI
jgi:hypothetical protein